MRIFMHTRQADLSAKEYSEVYHDSGIFICLLDSLLEYVFKFRGSKTCIVY